MQVFMKTRDNSGLWYVFCHDPYFDLGPFPSEVQAHQIARVIERVYDTGREEIQNGIRELLGASRCG